MRIGARVDQSCDFFRHAMKKRSENERSDRATEIARRSIGRRNSCLLEALCHLNKNQRVAFLRNADDKFIRCIRECVFNTLKGNVPLEQREKND